MYVENIEPTSTEPSLTYFSSSNEIDTSYYAIETLTITPSSLLMTPSTEVNELNENDSKFIYTLHQTYYNFFQ